MIQANNKIFPWLIYFQTKRRSIAIFTNQVFKKYPMQIENTDQKSGEEETLFLSPSLSVSRSNYKYY